MAGRAIRVGFGSNRTRNGIDPINSEEYNPTSEWKHESTVAVLLIHLPGFPKDRVKVSYDEHLRLVKLRGQQFLGEYKYAILDKDFDIPENCKEHDMTGKFDNGTLIITMPKRIIMQQISLEEITAKRHQEAPRSEGPSKRLKVSNICEEHAVVKEEEDSSVDENDQLENLENETDVGTSDEDKTWNLGRFVVTEVQEVQKSFVAIDNVVVLVRTRLNEEKQMLVNIGVAALTILALGTSICYKFGIFGVSQ